MSTPAARPLDEVVRPLRLPVWPVASGLACWASEAVGLAGLARAIERRYGGRVTPMQLPRACDPFLMLVHHRHTFSRWDPLRPLSALILPEGFPAHPHRGFETATYVLEGGMRHRDSTGVKMLYTGGSVQWLTAGRGVLHEEMWDTRARTHELYQLWVNLPRAHRWDAPEIQLLGPAEVDAPADAPIARHPLPTGERDGVRITALAGACRGVRSEVRTRSPMAVARLEWLVDAPFDWDEVPPAHTAVLYVRSGQVDAGGQAVNAGGWARFARGPEVPAPIRLTARAGTDALLLTGAPLGEPLAIGGSVVMSTDAEVADAHRDVAAGRFGRPWPPSASDADWRASLGC